jgi:penicillin-binding protein 1C
MVRARFITQDQQHVASLALQRIALRRGIQSRTAPHFVEAMRLDTEALLAELGDSDAWVRSGMRVRTTIDPEFQRIAEQVVLDARYALWDAGARHAALVAIDRGTREVLAYVGNVEYDDPDAGAVDMARAPRQTGSAIKPLVYAADLDRNGTNSGTFILDAPMPHLGNPKNYDGNFRGWMRIRNALGSSRNLPAIRAFLDAGGEEEVIRIAAGMGVTTPLAYAERARQTDPWFAFGWPMAIGSAEVPLIELVQGYATIAENGVHRPLRTVDRIDGTDGEPLLRIPAGQSVQAIDQRAANEIDEILRDPLTRPKGFWRDMLTIPGIETGVKTGTSNLCLRRSAVSQKCLSYAVNNVWTVGYDDRIVVGVWVGNADNAPMTPTADGLTVAAPIWREFLMQVHGKAVPSL